MTPYERGRRNTLLLIIALSAFAFGIALTLGGLDANNRLCWHTCVDVSGVAATDVGENV